jgi:diaminopimelate decarboxylase
MSLSCISEAASPPPQTATKGSLPVEAPVETLQEVVRRYGTPTYAYDLGRIRAQVGKLRNHLPPELQVLYSLKANASLGLCSFLASLGLGADVASAGELLTAVTAGFPPERILVSGPDKSAAVRARLRSVPQALLSLDSASELQTLADLEPPHRALLRLRPDFCSHATCSTGPDSRFGLLLDDLPDCRDYLSTRGIRVVGFHVFAGSQVLDAQGIRDHLRGAGDLSRRAGQMLGLDPEVIDLGGGFGVPYRPGEQELELIPIAEELRAVQKRLPQAQLVLELGRYLVAPSGWYLTTVMARQRYHGREAVVVDGGVHQRGDLCGLGLRTRALPPVVLAGRVGPISPTDVLGCLSLPSDVLGEACPLPPLVLGDVLAFPNVGAYGLGASPFHFHAQPTPAEVAFDEARIDLIRTRQADASILEGQRTIW